MVERRENIKELFIEEEMKDLVSELCHERHQGAGALPDVRDG